MTTAADHNFHEMFSSDQPHFYSTALAYSLAGVDQETRQHYTSSKSNL